MSKPILIDFNGKIACLSEHCRDLGIKISTVYSRHYRTGESYKECLEYFQENSVKEHAEYRDLVGDYKVKSRILYKRWHVTKQKCENPKHPAYKNYGGRGIKVCERWQNYENFEADLLESFLEHVKEYGIKDTTIDRWPNNDGDYEPNNVRWATRKEQANNKRHHNYSGYRDCKYSLPCKVSLSGHCKQNNYNYRRIIKYIKKYNLQPHEALAKWLEKFKIND